MTSDHNDDMYALQARLTAVEAERDTLRETVSRLNRRTQEAESALADLLHCNEKLASGAAWCSGSLGRAFLAYAHRQLTEERDRLAERVTKLTDIERLYHIGVGESVSLRAEIATLTERVRELEVALRPFAEFAADNDSFEAAAKGGDVLILAMAVHKHLIRLGDCRKARAALEGKQSELLSKKAEGEANER